MDRVSFNVKGQVTMSVKRQACHSKGSEMFSSQNDWLPVTHPLRLLKHVSFALQQTACADIDGQVCLQVMHPLFHRSA